MSEGLVFYRCVLCHGIVSPWDMEKMQGCPKCGHSRVSPTNMSTAEKIVQVLKHPAVWKWDKMSANNPATDSSYER